MDGLKTKCEQDLGDNKEAKQNVLQTELESQLEEMEMSNKKLLAELNRQKSLHEEEKQGRRHAENQVSSLETRNWELVTTLNSLKSSEETHKQELSHIQHQLMATGIKNRELIAELSNLKSDAERTDLELTQEKCETRRLLQASNEQSLCIQNLKETIDVNERHKADLHMKLELLENYREKEKTELDMFKNLYLSLLKFIDMNTENETQDQATCDSHDEDISSSQMLFLLHPQSIDMDVFSQHTSYENEGDFSVADSDETLEEAFNAFMRLQLVRKKATSLNYAMIVMRDKNNELKSAFDWVDIRCDRINAAKVDKKQLKDMQGTMYMNGAQSARNGFVLPDSILNITLKALEDCIGTITDTTSHGHGKALFFTIMSKLTNRAWTKHKVMKKYNVALRADVKFVNKLKEFTHDLCSCSDMGEVNSRGLLVFRYSLDTLIDTDKPDTFIRTLLHRHIPVPRTQIHKVLSRIKEKVRTQDLALVLNTGQCHCRRKRPLEPCEGECQTAYSCFYNASELHPFAVSANEYSCYFARLYPHLAKLERLSKEMKMRYRGPRQFGSIVEMVFNVLVRSCNAPLYSNINNVIDEAMSNSSLSLGQQASQDIHESFYLAPGMKETTRMILQVGRLFQASTTFNYIVTNTAPRYTNERIMLFNLSGPGEGKSYANKVLNYQFSMVHECIETLTSFTPQAFKYKQKRTAGVVFIDDAHIAHEKNIKASDKESNVIPNTFKNLLDTSMLESEVVTRDPVTGKVNTVKYTTVHNCGFVWNTNTLSFLSEAWKDRCVIMETEFPNQVTQTRSTKQIRDTVENKQMEFIAAVCLYRQNLIQSATMIAESEIMQFGKRFDEAREAYVAAFCASHIVCSGRASRRVSFCINQLVFAEAMKLACHFIFDIWIPPWTEVPDTRDYPDLQCYMKQLNENRLEALNKLTFGQICLETNAAYKLCAAACLPDICPRVADKQAYFACQTLGYVLTQIYTQNLKTSIKDGDLCISGIDTMFFPETYGNKENNNVHKLIQLCSTCTLPARRDKIGTRKTYTLCKYKCATNRDILQNQNSTDRRKKITSVQIPLEAVYDMLALFAPNSHAGFWDQLGIAMVAAYEKGEYEQGNAFGQCANDSVNGQGLSVLPFTLDLNQDPIRGLILEATKNAYPLSDLQFTKSFLGGEHYQCSAPLYYGGVLIHKMARDAPVEAYNATHLSESRLGPAGTFHGPRLSIYSTDYTGAPVKNVSSFCNTRTVYHQDRIVLSVDTEKRAHFLELEEDWEWKDAVEVLNLVHGHDTFSVEILKSDYAATMMVVKGELMTDRPQDCTKLRAMIDSLDKINDIAAVTVLRPALKPDWNLQMRE
ncbi:hypothetical protein WMY93_011372 [Mugilogobius chulae]|uniref:Uncharacterized protein n=1 Tax=Mugilogobius chulae TaxID=88201 RepID=A0AAW0P5P0_9GOBI